MAEAKGHRKGEAFESIHSNLMQGAHLDRSQSLDHPAGHFPASFDQGGPSAADRLTSSIGALLPIALCGRSSL